MSGGGKLALGGLGGCGTSLCSVLALLFGADPRQLLGQLPTTSGGEAPISRSRPTNPQEEELRQFVGVVLAETEDAWTDIFRQIGRTYRKPTLVIFNDQSRVGLRCCRRRGGTVLLSRRSEALHRSFVLPGSADKIRRAGRFCNRVRSGP